MGQFVNNILRTKNMVALLQAMGIPLNTEQVTCKDERVIFNSKTINDGDTLATNLQELLQQNGVKPVVRRVTVANLLADEINQGISLDGAAEDHKKSCLAILGVLQLGSVFTLDEEQEYFHIPLPSSAYAPLFNSLHYQYMSIEGGLIKFNIKEFLKNHKQELVLVDGANPLLFAHSDSFEKKKVFYAEKKVSEDTVEVTPYFFVPDALTPPVYHFVLDTSGSMEGKRLTTLKESVIKFADALFEFQPEATIHITEFNSTTQEPRSFQKHNLAGLTRYINNLSAAGITRLYGTVSEQLYMLSQSTQHNNILLFTDGENTEGNTGTLTTELELALALLQQNSDLTTVRNKFFILSYGINQPEILHRITKAFGSLVLDTHTIDFFQALSEEGKLQEWAAARELFTCRLEIAGSSNLAPEAEEYVYSLDMSGQFVALKSKQYKSGEILHLMVKDSSGTTLLDDTKPFAKKSLLLPGSAKAASHLGVFAVQDNNTKVEEDKLELSSVI
ncbi:VWA domain-containing protein [Fluoribacter dumoffii]|uniref:Uncharacterized protein encoded in toxicity protection region of plasmid R478, contains von Willebrand factor (VWF) domain n=1 Tax=Fluoribacter dumoffii TaxID=463 RepID=A0A377GEB3_9GAMM|nr:VWA domain-containing protein [Fluoribacter dumoffii]KTC91146.1 von Willebrand factor type A domain protein [Fluoribacter dumoffii NY 23]MCW8387687.1 VWA domain-containing protein [Fluoribacter dumoffii]MCW8416767.1 VWA domain-containing protein [Fluoribacter dumoffii]MCW8455393.1 VWA domain-containing protein [Fluoribacter dumoffii]MCW8460529.1 VWA domain-containing protein [Fluoribacter dumoffii]